MITNKEISLSPESKIRQDALNTIKYTLLLDYCAPEYTEEKTELIENVMQNCQNCCVNLFEDQKNLNSEFGYHFFGMNSSLKEPLSTYQQIGIIPARQTVKGTIAENNNKDLYLHKLILNHCVMSCYHAINTELFHGKTITSYGIINDPKNILIIENTDHSNKNNTPLSKRNEEKSSTASDFQKLANVHLKVLPMFKEISSLKQFGHLWYIACNLKAATFKNIYDLSSKCTMNNRIKKIADMNNYFESAHKESAYDLPSILYHRYLEERIFNPHLFYSLCKMMQYVNDKGFYRIDQNDLLPTLASITNLPNVFSRQYLLVYAMLHIDKETASNRDFWHFQDLSSDDNWPGVQSARTIKRVFDLYAWKDQFYRFTNYLSSFVIPVYEWCFTIMLLETIENHFPNADHTEHIQFAKKCLEEYMYLNCRTIVQPYYNLKTTEKWSIGNNVTNINTSFTNFELLDTLPEDIIKNLMALFFKPDKDLELNLSTNLNPDYFKNRNANRPNSNSGRIRKFYIDLLRYDYWEDK